MSDYVFERYPIYRSENSYNIKALMELSAEDRNLLIDLKKTDSLSSRNIVCFPGFEEHLEEGTDPNVTFFEKHGLRIRSELFIAPPFLDFESDSVKSSSDIMDSISYNFDVGNFESRNFIQSVLLIVARNMIRSNSHWDDKHLFHFYALNEFCADDVPFDKHFGEFVNENMDELYKNFRLGEGTEHQHSLRLMFHYNAPDKSLLVYEESFTKKISNFQKQDVCNFVSYGIKHFPSVSRVLNDNSIDFIQHLTRKHEPAVFHEEINRKVDQILTKIFYSGTSVSLEVDEGIVEIVGYDKPMKRAECFLYNSEIKKFLNKVEELFDSMQPTELLPLMVMLFNPSMVMSDQNNEFFMSADEYNRARFVNLMNYALNDGNINNRDLINFMTDVFMEYNYELPVYEEWMNFAKEGNVSNLIPASMAIPFILEPRSESQRDHINIEETRNVLRKVTAIATSDSNKMESSNV